jgi:hypothetical protein
MAEPKKINVELIPERDDKGEVRQPYAIMQALIPAHHPHLADAHIALAWRYGWTEDADGRLRLGQAKKASDLDFSLHAYDFVIILNSDAWNAAGFTEAQMRALLDHELCHCQVSLDENGDERRDVTGRPVWRMRKHDIEEFQEIVERHGLWEKDLALFAKAAIKKAQENPGLFDQMVGGGVAEQDAGAAPADAPETLTPAVAKAVKKLAMVGDGELSVTFTGEGGEPSETRTVTIDASNRDRIVGNCDAVIKAGIANDLPPDTMAELFEKAVPYCIEHSTVTAEGLHRHLAIPLRQAVKLTESLKATGHLADEEGKLVCKVTAEEWAQSHPSDAAA